MQDFNVLNVNCGLMKFAHRIKFYRKNTFDFLPWDGAGHKCTASWCVYNLMTNVVI